MFIVLEGGEGSGKTTQAKNIKNYLVKERSIDPDNIVLTREPGGIPIGEEIRNILINKEHTSMDAKTEALLFMASRNQHNIEVIKKALDKNKIVICDRYILSSFVYQGIVRGLGIGNLFEIHQKMDLIIKADLTLILDIDPCIGFDRVTDRNRFEMESIDFHRSINENYRSMINNPYMSCISKNTFVIDANKSEKEVFDEISNPFYEIICGGY